MAELLLTDPFDYPNGVITNEFAHFHPGMAGIHESPTWVATSGTLFAHDGRGYSGIPDSGRDSSGVPAVDIDSATLNGSAVLRVITRTATFLNVEVRCVITNLRLVDTGRSDGKDWNGLHVFMRRQDENNTYYVDINRRDNKVTIKRKLHGAYSPPLADAIYPVPYGSDQHIQVSAETLPNDFVDLRLYSGGNLLLQVTDTSVERILTPGAVGLRGDNCEFFVDDFQVVSLGDFHN